MNDLARTAATLALAQLRIEELERALLALVNVLELYHPSLLRRGKGPLRGVYDHAKMQLSVPPIFEED